MIHRVREWLDESLDSAEQARICLVAKTRTEQSRLRRAELEGLVVQVLPGAYMRPSHWSALKAGQQMLYKMRALHVRYPNWVFAGPSAAVVHHLPASNRHLSQVWVATRRNEHRRSNGSWGFLHVSDASTEEVEGLPVTSLPRTVGDCLRIMDFRSGLAVADGALRSLSSVPEEFSQSIDRACVHMPGLRRVRSVLSLADGRAESGGESIARATMLELGLALPDLQRWYDDPLVPGNRYRVDFAWDVGDKAILGELDGLEKYMSPEMTAGRSLARVIEEEHSRQTHVEARADVLRFVRFGFADVMRDWEFLKLLSGCGVPRSFAYDSSVHAAGGVLCCR